VTGSVTTTSAFATNPNCTRLVAIGTPLVQFAGSDQSPERDVIHVVIPAETDAVTNAAARPGTMMKRKDRVFMEENFRWVFVSDPRSEQHCEIGRTDDAITIEVGAGIS